MVRAAEDARNARVMTFNVEAMKRPFPLFKEFTGKKKLKAGQKMETDHLRLEVKIEKLMVGGEGAGVTASHVILVITNKTDKYLAYRVITTPPGKHQNKGTAAHNAIAIKPGESLGRTESLPPDEEKVSLTVRSVEVMEIPALGYHYISRLEPLRLRYDPRTSEGHSPPGKLPQCMIFPWRILFDLYEKKEAAWYDVIDFYARHDCNRYSYFKGYKWTEGGPERVPARPPGAAQAK